MTAQEKPSLRVEWFSKRFGDVVALDHASFTAHPGELLGLIGPNGAGKSTLFECVAGVLAADGGIVTVGENRLRASARNEALFFLPDGVQPWPEQRVGWVLEFAEGLFESELGARQDVTAALALDALLDKRVGALSKGQRKRVAVALGLITPQPFLLLDEPFDGLDLRQSREMETVLRAHAGPRPFFQSFDLIGLADAARICDRLALLSSGKSVGEGTLDALRTVAGVGNDAAIEDVFLALT